MHRKVIPLGDLPYQRDAIGNPIYPGSAGARAAMSGQPVPPGQPQRWLNKTTAKTVPFVIGLTSMQIVPANPLRAYLLVQNKDAGSDMLINFGQKATSFNGVIIIPRGNYEFIGGTRGGGFCPFDSVWVLGTAANMQGVLVEGVQPLD